MAHDRSTVIDEIFAEVGIPTLDVFLDGDRDFTAAGLTDEDVTNYSLLAASRWHGAIPTEVREGLSFFYFRMLSAACGFDGESTQHDDGRVTVPGPDGGEVEVTEKALRHWLWALSILNRHELAERWLAAVPEPVRAEAMAVATSVVDSAFAEVVAHEGAGQ